MKTDPNIEDFASSNNPVVRKFNEYLDSHGLRRTTERYAILNRIMGINGHFTIEELQNIPGVGAGKAKRYGSEFCKLIQRHCEDNDIVRPTDMRVRTVANKSKVKVKIIQAIDRKVSLEDIARSNGLDFDELLDEMEAIVYSGTKLNIDYYFEDIEMDEDVIDEIYDYFRQSETDDLDTALDNLDGDIYEEDVRLVRIKFISELAN